MITTYMRIWLAFCLVVSGTAVYQFSFAENLKEVLGGVCIAALAIVLWWSWLWAGNLMAKEIIDGE
jgi:hypothetical protein